MIQNCESHYFWNPYFHEQVSHIKFNVFNDSWENTNFNSKFKRELSSECDCGKVKLAFQIIKDQKIIEL